MFKNIPDIQSCDIIVNNYNFEIITTSGNRTNLKALVNMTYIAERNQDL